MYRAYSPLGNVHLSLATYEVALWFSLILKNVQNRQLTKPWGNTERNNDALYTGHPICRLCLKKTRSYNAGLTTRSPLCLLPFCSAF